MYISDVIERAKALHPSEYTTKEYLQWCDELSADIRRNYDIQYGKIKANSSSVLLPENVSIHDISKIIMDGRELKKTDLRDFGIEYEYLPDGKLLKKTDGSISDFEIIYATAYTPIRYIDEDMDVCFSGNSFTCPGAAFMVGDTLKITADDTVYTVHIIDIGDGGFVYEGDSVPEGEKRAHVYREITDKTLLPAPYDSAYMDFINAKIALYQGDADAYQSFMSQFSTKLSDYRSWLTRNMPRTETKFKNWF